ncbi:hypothetical protein BGZ95_002808 [Linnemannia exigua]|uniref:F-box domain-containing protein n=1 Tax=Linnemannia exigua TaxID=604196 RepID=A0AAD4D6S4_9FUNG|nr:hypothetical protein BGZ95_002808 [Linnemannia exigua]
MSQSQQSPATATFLGVPELLDMVFAFVSQDTLRKTVILVCRNWFFLNRQRVSRELSWDFKWFADDPAKALKRLPGAGRLVWKCDHYCKDAWPKLIKSLKGVEKRRLHPSPKWKKMWPHGVVQGDDNPIFNQANNLQFRIFSPLRQVELFSDYNLSDESLNLLAFPPTLTTLKIFRYSFSTFDVGRIFAICPYLEVLHAGSRDVLNLQGPWTSQELSTVPETLPLRSLVLDSAKLSQSWLECLVSRTPLLKELKIINLSSPSGSFWDWSSLFHHLRSQPFTLNRFHYSVHGEIPSEDDLDDMLYALCPNGSERTLWSYNLLPGIVRSLTEQPSVLTNLDILRHHLTRCHADGWKEGEHFYSSTPLHRLLCESPSLRHLKSLKVPYLIEHMDIHRRIKTAYESMFPDPDVGREVPTFHPGVWVCRGLQILRIQVHSHGGYDLRGVENRDMLLGFLSRTLFSYISKVTPQLRDLCIEEPYSCSVFPGRFSYRSYLSEHLFGGLPLLSSLQYLERLRVEFEGISCGISQLNWILSAGRSMQDKNNRRAIISKWENQLEREGQMEAIRLQGIHPSPLSGGRLHDVKLLEDLQHTGLLREVKTRIEAIDSDNSQCFSSLLKLSLSRELERSPERSMDSIFPPSPAKKTMWSLFST